MKRTVDNGYCTLFQQLESGRFGQLGFEFGAGFGNGWRVEDGADDTDAGGSGGKYVVEIGQVDAPNGEPRDFHIRSSPADVINCHRLGRRFGTGGVDRADGDVIRRSSQGTLGLLWRVCTQAHTKLMVEG